MTLCLLYLASAQAEEVASLPTIKVMADSELREEVGFVPYQEDKTVRKALQHHIQKGEQDIQNIGVNDIITPINFQPKAEQPDMSGLSPALQQYVLAVASGLQSSDPTSGLFQILKPLGIDRNNVDGFRNGTIKMNIDNEAMMNFFGDKWQPK